MITGPRVLLVLPPGTAAGTPYKVTHQPIVSAYLAAAARRAGADVTVADAMLEGLTPTQVAQRANTIGADLVAVVPFEYRRELPLDTSAAIAAAVRDLLPAASVGFLNGVENHEIAALKSAVRSGVVDFVATGDSEDSFEAVLRTGLGGNPPAGVIKRDAAGVPVEGPHRAATDLNTLAFPDWTPFRWQDYAI